jgi:hypothetical protein
MLQAPSVTVKAIANALKLSRLTRNDPVIGVSLVHSHDDWHTT